METAKTFEVQVQRDARCGISVQIMHFCNVKNYFGFQFRAFVFVLLTIKVFYEIYILKITLSY